MTAGFAGACDRAALKRAGGQPASGFIRTLHISKAKNPAGRSVKIDGNRNMQVCRHMGWVDFLSPCCHRMEMEGAIAIHPIGIICTPYRDPAGGDFFVCGRA